MRLVLALVASIALLAGCGDDEPEAEVAPTSSAASEPTDEPRAFSTVVELRDAAMDAGYGCYDWKQTDAVKLAAESGTCGDDDVFTTYASDGDLQQQLDTYRQLAELGANDPMLVGPNWIIVSPTAPSLEAELGGTVNR